MTEITFGRFKMLQLRYLTARQRGRIPVVAAWFAIKGFRPVTINVNNVRRP